MNKRPRAHAPSDEFVIMFAGAAIQNMALASGLRGKDLVSACVGEASMMDELRSALGLDSTWSTSAEGKRA